LKISCLTVGILLAASSTVLAQSSGLGQDHIKQAESFVRAALGEDCEMNSRTDIPLNSKEPEDVSHFVYEIRYRTSYQAAEEPEKRAELYQMFCGMGAYNLQHSFLLRDDETGLFHLVAFAQPKLAYDYADTEMTKLNSAPTIAGFTANHILINATYDPARKVIASHGLWRGIGDAWSSGEWTFADFDFVLSRYEVDPTFDGAAEPDHQKSYVVYP
jgi:hypothetical protein